MHVAGVERAIADAGRHAGPSRIVEGRGPVGGIRPVVPVRHGDDIEHNRVMLIYYSCVCRRWSCRG